MKTYIDTTHIVQHAILACVLIVSSISLSGCSQKTSQQTTPEPEPSAGETSVSATIISSKAAKGVSTGAKNSSASTAATSSDDAGITAHVRRGSLLASGNPSQAPHRTQAVGSARGNDGGVRVNARSNSAQICEAGLRLVKSNFNTDAVSMLSVALQKIDAEAPYQQTWVVSKETLNRDQFEAYVYKLRATAFMQQGDRQACIADLSDAIKRCPNDASSYIARSDAYRQSNMPEEAEADYERGQALGGNP